MRIVDRKTFLSLPANTVYCTYQPCYFGPIEIKGDSLANDWFLQSLDTVKGDSCDERTDILEAAELRGEAFQFDFECEHRDGCFEDKDLYAVWENDDILSLISRLQECIK